MIVLPVGHEQTTVRRLPLVTFGLMALCLAAHLVSLDGLSAPGGSEAGTLERFGTLAAWGVVPAGTAPATWLTHMFLHVGWLHLLGNLLILYLAGPFIEDVWGRPLFAVFFLASGVIAAACHVAGNPTAVQPMVGSSGAIAGLMGAFLVRYGNTRIRFFYLFLWLIRGTFFVSAWVILPLWFVHQLTLAVLDSGSGVAYWAHVGGFAGGAGLALLIRGVGLERHVIGPALSDKIHRRVLDNSHVERGLSAGAGALTELRRTLESDLTNPDAARALWTVATERGEGARVTRTVLRAVAAQLGGPQEDAALDLWAEMLETQPDLVAEPPLLVRLGERLVALRRVADARATWRRALDQREPPLPPPLAMRLAGDARAVDSLLALTAVEQVLADPASDAASRREAEVLHAELEPVEAHVEPAIRGS